MAFEVINRGCFDPETWKVLPFLQLQGLEPSARPSNPERLAWRSTALLILSQNLRPYPLLSGNHRSL